MGLECGGRSEPGRALSPHVGARAFHSGVEGPVKIWRAEVFEGEVPTLEAGAIRTENGRILVGCGVGVLEVLELQMPGGSGSRPATSCEAIPWKARSTARASPAARSARLRPGFPTDAEISAICQNGC